MFNDKILNSITEIIKDKEVYLVGGYLRNYFINNEISTDRDLAILGDSKALAIEISQKLNGRGGGRDGMIQGKAATEKQAIIDFFKEV
jgi:tRNA nucleotidyltransferase/poly(A) polymerase